MKRASRNHRSTRTTPDLIRRYVQTMAAQHHEEWYRELTDAAPHWEYLLGVHLRLIELEHLESAVAELL